MNYTISPSWCHAAAAAAIGAQTIDVCTKPSRSVKRLCLVASPISAAWKGDPEGIG